MVRLLPCCMCSLVIVGSCSSSASQHPEREASLAFGRCAVRVIVGLVPPMLPLNRCETLSDTVNILTCISYAVMVCCMKGSIQQSTPIANPFSAEELLCAGVFAASVAAFFCLCCCLLQTVVYNQQQMTEALLVVAFDGIAPMLTAERPVGREGLDLLLEAIDKVE